MRRAPPAEMSAGPCSSAVLRSVVALLLCVVMATGKAIENDHNCLQIGGMCSNKKSCPKDSRSNDTTLCNQKGENKQVCCFGSFSYAVEDLLEVRTNDPNCLRIGGMCSSEDSCPQHARSNETGLCNESGEGNGVCCFGTLQNASCHSSGGRCGNDEECRNVQDFGQRDCAEGSRCCLLIY